jgi:hypothetical protein
MATTYKQLQDRVLTYGYGEVDRANVKTWLNETYEDLVRSFKWPWLQATQTITTVAGTQTVALPASPPILFFGRLKPTSSSALKEPKFLSEMDFRDYMPHREFTDTTSAYRGQPKYYSIFAGNINFYPVPDAVYTYSLRYWKGIATLPTADSDTYLCPDPYLDNLVVGALARAAMRENDMGKYQVYTAQYVANIAQMMRNAKAEQGETPRRASLASTYAGVYDRE